MHSEPALVRDLSLIAGQGLFTRERIAAGRTVLELPATPASVVDLGPVNHSCDPNLRWADGRTLVARADIAAGAEMTVDYATALDDPSFALMCHCGTYRCRQMIEGRDWAIPQLQSRYAGAFTPGIARRIADSR